ncbi:MAG: hypothetical protein ACKVKG_07730, partial [Alphaproteobacteria bacterium]
KPPGPCSAFPWRGIISSCR